MSAITAKASRKMKKYAVLTREPRCFLGSFDFSWEQRKLGELVDVCSGRDYKHLSEGTIPVYGTGGYMLSVNDALSYDRDAIGIGRKGTIDRPYILKAPFWTVDTLFYAIPREKVDLDYAFDIFQNIDWKKKDESTGVPSLSKTAINDIDVLAPKHDEQQIIGQFFAAIDNLITLHQRKCALLFSPFQALISMMFTTSTFSWEQRKLGELALFNPKDELPRTFEYVDLESVVGTEMLSHRTEVKSSAPSRAQRLAHTGDLFYQTVRPYQKNNYLFEKPDNNYVFSTGYAQMRPYVDGYFLLSLVQSERFVKVVLDNCTGTSYPAINANDLAEIEVAAPSDESEAQKIGTIFRCIDNLITLHQRKCISFTGRAGRLISTVNKKRITSSWEQRKLGEIGSVSMCRRIFKEQTSETGDIPFYKIGTFGAEPDAFISRELFEEYKSKYPYPKKGDILISASGSIGRTVEFAGNNEYFQDSNIVWLSHDERLSNSFLKCFYSVVKWAGIEGSTIKRLYNDNILNTVICMPSVPEQEHIGLFFENLDNLITLHQRKPFLMKWRNSDANRNQTNRLVL